MKLRNYFALVTVWVATSAFSADSASTALLKQALAAQGGEQALRAVKSVSFEGSGYRNMLEQSERPEGPYLIAFQDLSELHDHAHHALRSHLQVRPPPAGSYTLTTVVANNVAMQVRGGRANAGQQRGCEAGARIAGPESRTGAAHYTG